MKKILLLLGALFAFNLSVFASGPGVTFLLRSGQKVSFAFAEKPVVAFSNENLAVSVGGEQRVSYAYADVQRVFVEDDVVSAVGDVVANAQLGHAIFTLLANTLSAIGLIAGDQLSLYAADGKLMLTAQANAEGSAKVSLSTLQQGVYVVRTQSGINYKLFKK